MTNSFGPEPTYETPTSLDWTEQVFHSIHRNAVEGNPQAQFQLARLYESGFIPKNLQEAVTWYEESARGGEAAAKNNLAFLYERGHGVKKDAKKALELYLEAAEQGYATSQHNLVYFYKNGIEVPKDLAKAFEWCRLAAEQDHPRAQFDLGAMYEEGVGVEDNVDCAIEWYTKASDNEHPNAQSALEKCLSKVSHGHSEAQFEFGEMYAEDENDEVAFTWFQKSANDGNQKAMQRVAEMLEHGRGVAPNFQLALDWYLKAGDQDQVEVFLRIGAQCVSETSDLKDHTKAFECFLKAAELGSIDAQNRVGQMYERGDGVPRNYIYGYAWANIAAGTGELSACECRDRLESKMTKSQISEAQRISSRWEPGHRLTA